MILSIEVIIWLATCSLVVNLICTWWSWRQIRAYYRAHDLLMDLCFRAWILRRHQELWPLYEETIGRWRMTRRRKP